MAGLVEVRELDRFYDISEFHLQQATLDDQTDIVREGAAVDELEGQGS